jgi:hypothetical protein
VIPVEGKGFGMGRVEFSPGLFLFNAFFGLGCMFPATDSLTNIERDLEQMLQYLVHYDKRAPEISAWSVGQQIEHATKVTRFALNLAFGGEGAPPVGGQRLAALVVLTLGWIPPRRESPNAVLPVGITAERNAEYIREELELIKTIRAQVQRVDSDLRRFQHPVLGPMTPSQWLRMAAIHQRHHLKIIRRIIAKPVF